MPGIAVPTTSSTLTQARLGLPAIDLRQAAILAALLAFWTLCNPFFGVDASNLIYAGRALADLDPGVGRDAMFVHDGQSGFTLFTAMFRALAGAIGLSRASVLIAAAAVVAAFAGAVVLAASLAPGRDQGRARALIVAFAAALPAQYGGYKIFSYAEVAATPRPFAEALVLCGIAALLHRRPIAALALMAAAALLHPIMAASGVALVAAWLVIDDRRWLAPLALAPVAVALAAVAGIAPFDRIATIVDPAWSAIVEGRNPQLFPSLWLDGSMGRLAVRVATLAIAARFAPPQVRRLFLLVIPIGLTGLAAAYCLGERADSLIVLQAQTWRMMWLVFALATAAAALATLELWKRGGTMRVALGFLALAWAFADCDQPAALFALVSVAIVFVIDPRRYAQAERWLDMGFAALLAWAIYGLVRTELALLATHATPDAITMEVRRSMALGLDYTPLAVLAAVAALGRAPRLGAQAIAAFAVVGAVVVALVWDQRSAANIYYDSGAGAPDLVQRIAARPGEVYWIDGGRQTWWWLHRPQWLAPIQGAGLVFSRELALLYRARTQRAVAAGLAAPRAMEPLRPPQGTSPREMTAAGVAAFCAAADAPAWIVAPLDGAAPPPAGLAFETWTAPIAEVQPRGDSTWRPVSRFAIIPCAGAQKT